MSTTCTRCGQSTPGYSAGGVCLACAAERILAPETGEPAPTRSRPASGLPGALPDRIGGYEIIEELGQGGMGRVYAARQVGLGRIVALKALPLGEGRNELELRFLREAQTLARLRHPHIVAVHDSGRSGAFAFLAMDYIEGGDLARRLRSGPLGVREAAVLVRKVAEALAYTHGQSLLHRDLKPSNILLDGEEPRVADFGLAAELEAWGDLTVATQILGTPQYLAPEAIRGGSAALSIASDIYALGAVLFEALTGRTPFAGASLTELAAMAANSEPPSPRLFAPAVPRDLETICLKCLEWDPSRRYRSADELAEDLRRFLAGEMILARPVSGPAQLLRWCRRRPALAGIWLLLMVLAAGSITAAAWIGHERTRAEVALGQARAAEAEARVGLREAKIAEAQALRQTETPGRRDRALAALAAAAKIQPGVDLRNEAIAALVLPDVRPVSGWAVGIGEPVQVTLAPGGDIAAIDRVNSMGTRRGRTEIRRWGDRPPGLKLAAPAADVTGIWRFSPDRTLVMARFRDDKLRIWRVDRAAPILALDCRPGADPRLPSLFNEDYDFGPGNAWVALGRVGSGGVALHRLPDGAPAGLWAAPAIFSVMRFSPDGRQLAAIATSRRSPGAARVYLSQPPAFAVTRTLDTGEAPSQLAWSQDSRILAVGLADSTVALYDLQDGRILRRFPVGQSDISSLALVGDGLFLASRGIGGNNLRLTTLTLGRQQLLFDNVSGGPISVDPAGNTFVVGSFDNRFTRWQVVPPAGLCVLPAPRLGGYGYGSDNGGLDFSPDGRWIATGHARYAVVRDSRTGRLAAEIDYGQALADDLGGVVFGPGGDVLLHSSARTGVRRHFLRPDGQGGLVAGPGEVLDAETGYLLLACSPDHRRLLLVDEEGDRVKSLEWTGSSLRTLARWPVIGAYSGTFSPDGAQVLINCSGMGASAPAQRLRLYRAADGAQVRQLDAPVSCDAAWSRDGGTVLTSNGQRTSILWDTATWRPRLRLSGSLGGNITTFTLSPDGQYAVIQMAKVTQFVSTRSGMCFAAIEIPESPGLASSIKFSPDGRRFAILWHDGRVDVFEPAVLRAELARLGLAW